jgi:putative cardiolipin synthase
LFFIDLALVAGAPQALSRICELPGEVCQRQVGDGQSSPRVSSIARGRPHAGAAKVITVRMSQQSGGNCHRARLAGVALVFSLAACATPRLGSGDLPPAPASLRAAFDAMPSGAGGGVRVLDDNVDAWVARMQVLEGARQSIDVQYFIVEADAFGLSLLGLLAEKARAGVKVRLMVDARGTAAVLRGSQRYLIQEAQRAGVDVRVYNPILFQLARTVAHGDLRGVTASNHDKLILVDGRFAISGGRNLSKDYLSDPRDQAGAFTDMDVVYDSPSTTKHLTRAFESEFNAKRTTPLIVEAPGDGRTALALALATMRAWLADPPMDASALTALDDDGRAALGLALQARVIAVQPVAPSDAVAAVLNTVAMQLGARPRLRGGLSRTLPPFVGEVGVRVLDTHSVEGAVLHNTVNENLLVAVQGAQKSIVIQSPYFVMTERGQRALEAAAARGVEIIVLTNSPVSSDSPITQAAFLKQWPELLARIPTARIFVVAERRLMHAKVGVMDDELAFVGSYNLDPLSAGVNGEVVGALWSPAVARQLAGLIRGLIDRGPPGVVEYRIARDAAGNVVRKDGAPVVAYGPDNHCSAEQLAEVRKLEPLLDLLAPIL